MAVVVTVEYDVGHAANKKINIDPFLTVAQFPKDPGVLVSKLSAN